MKCKEIIAYYRGKPIYCNSENLCVECQNKKRSLSKEIIGSFNK